MKTATTTTWKDVQQQTPPTVVHMVDRFGVGWTGSQDHHYCHPDPQARRIHRDVCTMQIDQLTTSRGPLRVVLAAPQVDMHNLHLALCHAGGRCLATLAYALHQVATATRADLGAGWPDSSHSRVLRRLTELGAHIAAFRVAAEPADALARILHCWVMTDTHFVEVGHHLSTVLGWACDRLGGWTAMADIGLQSCGMAPELRWFCTQHSQRYPLPADHATHRVRGRLS